MGLFFACMTANWILGKRDCFFDDQESVSPLWQSAFNSAEPSRAESLDGFKRGRTLYGLK